MHNLAELLKSTPLFGRLTIDELNEVVSITRHRPYKKGEQLFSEGEDSHGFFIILKGKIKIFKTSSGGKEHVLHIASVGESFSEAACFADMPYPAGAEALVDSTLIFFPKKDFLTYLKQHSDLAIKMLASMSIRLKRMTDQIQELAGQTVEERLASYIIKKLDSRMKNGSTFNLDIDKNILANHLGTTPETLSRTFKKMKKNNMISIEKKKISILDADALCQISDIYWDY